MLRLDPFLLAGASEVTRYQQQRVAEWQALKQENPMDFDRHFNDLLKKWDYQSEWDACLNADDLSAIDGIDTSKAQMVYDALVEGGALNDLGYISLNDLSPALLDPLELSEAQAQAVMAVLIDHQGYAGTDSAVISPQSFMTNAAMTLSESQGVWTLLNDARIIDNYGLLQHPRRSAALETAVNAVALNGKNASILGVLNKAPLTSYPDYVNTFRNQSPSSNQKLPTLAFYNPNGPSATDETALLDKDAFDAISLMALLEWSLFIMNRRSNHRIQTRIDDTKKQDKKETQIEEQKHLEQLWAQYQNDIKKQQQASQKRS